MPAHRASRRQIALGLQHVADVCLRHGQVALPTGIAGVGLGQALSDAEPGAVALQRRRPDQFVTSVALRYGGLMDDEDG